MKGIAPIAVLVAFIVVMGGIGWYATGGGTNFVAAVASIFSTQATLEPGCFVLNPEYRTVKCEDNSKTVTESFQSWTGGDCGLGTVCWTATCTNTKTVTTSKCTVKVTDKGSAGWFSYPNIFNCPSTGCTGTYEKTAMLSYGGSVKIYHASLWLNPALVIDATSPMMGLRAYETTTGRFSKELGDGCNVATLYGTDVYNNWPVNQPKDMTLGQSFETVIAWQPYQVAGNTFVYSATGQDAQCIKTGASTSAIYSLVKWDGGGCYYYRNKVIANGECCPGEHNAFGQACGSDFKFGATTGQCCPSAGLCSVSYCPGEGDWAWSQWAVGQSLKKYICNSLTATCDVAGTNPALCNPSTGLGCATGQRCDPITFTCGSLEQRTYECVETGRECCIATEVPGNVKLRSCVQAGYPTGWECHDGNCYAPVPISVCDYDRVCDPNENTKNCSYDCGVDWLSKIIAFLWLWIIGSVIGAIIIVVIGFFVPVPFVGTAIWKKPKQLIALSILFGLLIALLFTPFVASVASMVGVV